MGQEDEARTRCRELLQSLEQEAQRSYDKTVLTLSGGALGISLAFVTDIVGGSPIQWHAALVLAWVLWVLSVTAVLISFFCSNRALGKAIAQFDENKPPDNPYDTTTGILNVLGGVFFLAGVVSIVVFAAKNIG